ncbi:MAG TPA: hypothetical protein VKA18_14490 [Alphaproteobacteria bacterium]|nr:hypothetical protein [Alphaproteobacteria bacterium]
MIEGEGYCVSNETPEGFDLLGDHRNDLALAHPAKMRQREPKHPAVEFEPETAQHPLPQSTAKHIQEILEAPVDENQNEEAATKKEQVADLVELETLDFNRKNAGRRTDCVIDDALGQFRLQINEGK